MSIMKSIDMSRRGVLTLGAVALAGASSLQPAPADASDACGGLGREEFLKYITLFNNNDPGFIKYYHDDVVLELSGTEIRTPQGIKDFYANVKAHIHEKVEVAHVVSDATGLAAMLQTEFRVYKDWKDSFFRRDLTAGEIRRQIGFVLYWVENGKFKQIKSSRYKMLNDWRMEA